MFTLSILVKRWSALLGALLLFCYQPATSQAPPAIVQCATPKADPDLWLSPPPLASTPLLAIIIDDLGYQQDTAPSLFSLHPEITLAIIPFTPYGTELASLAFSHKFEVMVHAPMETIEDRPWETALRTTMNEAELTALGLAMIKAVPNAKGLNNHGGSLLTQYQAPMDWLMGILATQQLYFIDSRTTAKTVASTRARIAGITHGSRDIFLDNVRSAKAISHQLEKAVERAHNQGYAIAIGHPYPKPSTYWKNNSQH
jgi:Uncharacterized protein conserved in bacteria